MPATIANDLETSMPNPQPNTIVDSVSSHVGDAQTEVAGAQRPWCGASAAPGVPRPAKAYFVQMGTDFSFANES